MTKVSALLTAQKDGLHVPIFMVIGADVRQEEVDERFQEWVGQAKLPKHTTYSVRSSASAEDGAMQSFAGQFLTMLSVKPKDISDAVAKCRQSLGNENVSEYTSPDANISMDVIIQVMIDATLSGVAFSSNPNGMLNETVITVARGAGTVVSDTADVTTYYYHQDDAYIDQQKSSDDSPELDHATLEKIIELVKTCQLSFGTYIDIEFAIEGTDVWLLQVRPITTIEHDDIVVFDNHNIVESYPGISLPLTQSFSRLAYEKIFRQLFIRYIGAGAAKRYDPVFRSMVRALHGRMYYQVSSWYTLLELLPLRHRIIPIWEQMIGVSTASIRLLVTPRFRDRFRLGLMTIMLTPSLPKRMQRLHDEFLAFEARFQPQYKDAQTIPQLLALFDDLQESVLRNWDLTLANDMYGFIYTGIYTKMNLPLARLMTDSGLPSTQLIHDFAALAEQFQASDERSTLMHLNDTSLQSFLSRSTTPLSTALSDYIEQYGDRVPGELKLETDTFRSRPSLLVEELVHYEASSTPHTTESSSERLNLIARCIKKRALVGIFNRERSRLDRARIFGMVRQIMLRIGEEASRQGVIDSSRDVFFLSLDELRDIDTVTHSLINERRALYQSLEHIPAYSRMVFPSNRIVEKQPAQHEAAWLGEAAPMHGIACSAGEVEAEAVVISDLAKAGDVRGKIIITETTDPGWVFMLSRAAGVIAEKGSLLSHTAIVSREMHLPSIVGVAQVTRRIASGDMVYMNGSTGEVRVVS